MSKKRRGIDKDTSQDAPQELGAGATAATALDLVTMGLESFEETEEAMKEWMAKLPDKDRDEFKKRLGPRFASIQSVAARLGGVLDA